MFDRVFGGLFACICFLEDLGSYMCSVLFRWLVRFSIDFVSSWIEFNFELILDIFEHGFEYQLGVNFISHFLLTWLLLPVIKRAGSGARIVNVTCSQHKHVVVNRQLTINHAVD